MNKVEQVVSCFESGYNCSQAICSTYSQIFGIDKESALKIGHGMGAGMGRMGKTCGAVTEAFLVLGLTSTAGKESRDKVYALVREFAAEFESRNKTISCSELLDGCDLRTSEGQKTFKDKHLIVTHCTKFVRDAAEILEEMLKT